MKPNDLTLRQLSYFVALAETGQFRKAAARIGIAQPSLSQQIAGLEAALGLTLIERGRSGALLTPAGRDVLDRARRMLDEAEGLRELGATYGTGLGGTLRLGSTPTLGPYILPSVVRRLHQTYPELKLVIRDGAPQALVEDLANGRHDLILTQLPVSSPDASVERLFREPLALAVARDHPLAGREMATDADLAGEDVLTLSPDFVLHGQIAGVAAEAGAQLRTDYEGTSLDALRQMVAMGMGITFMPALYARSEIMGRGDDVRLVTFRKNRLTRSIGLAARRSSGGRTGLRRLTETIRAVTREDFEGIVATEG